MSEKDASPTPEERPARRELDYGWLIRATPLAVLIALFIVFAAQNAERVDFDFLTWTFTTRRIVLLIGAAVFGALVWEMARFFVRRRRSRRV